MASSVARMPRDDWRDPNRIAAGVFGARAPFSTPLNVRVPFLASSSSSAAAPVGKPNDVRPRRAEPASATAASAAEKRRQSRILDRWAARQAREMVTTIERQAHEAEISEIATVSRPVAARAATFLRESSPVFSESSAGGSSVDVPTSVRASSLIQMWRELEAEATLPPTPRTAAASNSGFARSFVSSDACDDSEAYGDWESDMTAPSEPNCSPMPESERGRVGDIVRMLSVGSRTKSLDTSEASWSDDAESSFREQSVAFDRRDMRGSLTLLRVRTRRELEDFLLKLEQERRREFSVLAERHAVSHFSHRRRIQSVIRLKLLRRKASAQDHHFSTSMPSELNQTGSSILLLRQRFSDRGHHSKQNGCEMTTVGSSHSSQAHIQSADNAQDACCSDSNLYPAVLRPNDPEGIPTEPNSPQARSEDLQEENIISDVTWDQSTLQANNLDWQRSLGSSEFRIWQDEGVTEEPEPYSQQDTQSAEINWLSSPSDSWRVWGVPNQTTYTDLVVNFPDNVEIHDLLERRRVSTSLSSDFRHKMDRLILSFLHRQGQLSDEENTAEEYENQVVWRQFEDYDNADQVASSSSLVPLPYHGLQHGSSICHSSQHVLDMKVSHELRGDMSQLRREISELQKLVESCMQWQMSLQHTIKQEVSAAVHQSFRTVSASQSSKSEPTRKDNCCICDEMPVDSLLYRCGHMCTCFKCAHELQWGSGRCPTCEAPIVDVVRAYPKSLGS